MYHVSVQGVDERMINVHSYIILINTGVEQDTKIRVSTKI